MTTPSGDAGFAMDVAGVRQGIQQYQSALDQLVSIRRDAIRLGQLNAPLDQVSQDAAQALIATGVRDKGSFLHALDEGIARIRTVIAQFQDAADAYERGDEQAGSDIGTAQ